MSVSKKDISIDKLGKVYTETRGVFNSYRREYETGFSLVWHSLGNGGNLLCIRFPDGDQVSWWSLKNGGGLLDTNLKAETKGEKIYRRWGSDGKHEFNVTQYYSDTGEFIREKARSDFLTPQQVKLPSGIEDILEIKSPVNQLVVGKSSTATGCLGDLIKKDDDRYNEMKFSIILSWHAACRGGGVSEIQFPNGDFYTFTSIKDGALLINMKITEGPDIVRRRQWNPLGNPTVNVIEHLADDTYENQPLDEEFTLSDQIREILKTNRPDDQ